MLTPLISLDSEDIVTKTSTACFRFSASDAIKNIHNT